MNLINNANLADYSTMRLGGLAKHLIEIRNKTELVEAVEWAKSRQLPVIMIGGGSNILWRDEGFAGLVVVNKIMGYQLVDDELSIGSGEIWDRVVERTASAGLTGIECLSLIPGSAGATPVQNVGAYGQEIADTLISVEAYDTTTNDFVTILKEDCHFSYRNSRFKSSDRGRFFITSIRLKLKTGQVEPPYYNALQRYIDEHNITDFSPSSIRNAVIAIRQSKLPDPAVVANNGSFFANPIISLKDFERLSGKYPDMPHWQITDASVKLSAAWLVDEAGFRDYHDAATGMATWPQQPLVLINEHARTTSDLLDFRQKILDTVLEKFGITLAQEPELLP